MKKQLLTIAIVMPFISVGAYAHHPAADIVDPEIYAMIDENVSDVHAALTFDDMGRDSADAGDLMQSRDDFDAPMESRDDMGTENTTRDSTGEVAADARGPFEQTRNEDGADDTIDMLDDVVSTLSD